MATASSLRRAFDSRFDVLDLRLSEASLLAYIAENGANTQTNLARGLGIGRAATGSIIDALEKRALVERQPDPSDRRVWLVQITAPGKEMVGRIVEIDVVLRSELRAGIGREERQVLAGLLLRLQDNLAAVLEAEPND